MLQRVMLLFLIFCQKFFVSQCPKYSQVNHSVLCFGKFPLAKRFMDKGAGSIKIFHRDFFMSHCAENENFRRGILYCCISFGY